MASSGSTPRAHPHIAQPLLYISELPVSCSDTELAEWFKECLPIRLKMNRDQGDVTSGTVEFREIIKAEKALTTLSPILRLSPYPPPYTPLPVSQDSLPRIVTGFGAAVTAGEVWQLLRPVAIREIRMGENGWPVVGGAGGSEAIVEFWYEDDARRFENDPPRSLTGQPLSIIPYSPYRQVPQHRESLSSIPTIPTSFSPEAQPFIPTGPTSPGALKGWTSPEATYAEAGGLALAFGPGQQVQPAGMGSTSASGLIDPCNLFCKNLDPNMSSNDLFAHFRSFGRIVSARVMRDDVGTSKGFGFVSFQTPEEAHLALSMMDGVVLGTKQITVRLHEPKRVRAEKLAGRAGLASPPGHYAQLSGSGAPSPGIGRRMSGGFLATPPQSSPRLNVEELQNMTPERRKSILTHEVGKRVRENSGVKREEMDSVVTALVGLDLGVVDALKDKALMGEKINDALILVQADSTLSTVSSPKTNTASSTPGLLLSPSSPPTTTSPSSPPSYPDPPQQVTPTPASERSRLLAAITRLEPDSSLATQCCEMILSLPKKERALCLFNVEHLKLKVAEAKEVLATLGGDLEDDFEEGQVAILGFKPPFATPQRTKSAPVENPSSTIDDLLGLGLGVSKQAIAASTPSSPAALAGGLPAVAALEEEAVAEEKLKGVKEIASWSAKGILTYLRDNERALEEGKVEGVVKPEDGKRREMELFLKSVTGRPVAQQKQQLGERLFKVMKTWELPRSIRAPKLTVQLLDGEDFVSLGHLLAEFPAVLREKVLLNAVPASR